MPVRLFPLMSAPLVMLDSFDRRCPASWRFNGLVTTVSTCRAAEVARVMAAAEAAAADGHHAVGFIAYEAATALNPELPAMPPHQGLPLVWFAVFREKIAVTAGSGHSGTEVETLRLAPDVTEAVCHADIEKIRDLIAAGESYQINYTFNLSGRYSGNPLNLYAALCRTQRAGYCGLLDIGSHIVISASPELFFSLQNGTIVTRPMKGTAPRGRWPAEDRQLADRLRSSNKEQAENLMIVDLLRNDLGKIAATGSVKVDSLFDIEQYPTLHQMTSTVSARIRPGLTVTDILRALFPCGSVTGAPKRRSMAVISELEGRPRGVYCGAIGCISPGGEALFSVAIRTLLLEKATGRLSMGVGSGITIDSRPAAEYAEALSKAAFVNSRPFSLFETIRLENGRHMRLDRHLDRLEASAGLLGFPFDRQEALRLIEGCAAPGEGASRVKLVLTPAGGMSVTAAGITAEPEPMVVGIAAGQVDQNNRLTYHKTTLRDHFEQELAARPECSELLFCNSRGELTEGSYNNILLKVDGELVTPPLASGILPGIMRAELLEAGRVAEKTLYRNDLLRADEIWLVNSLRGMRRAVLGDNP